MMAANHSVTLLHGQHDTTDAHLHLQQAIENGSSFEIDGNIVQMDGMSYFVNAHSVIYYKNTGMEFPHKDAPETLHPAHLFPEIIRSKTLLKCDFKSPDAVVPFAYLAQMLPSHQKLGHAFVKELVIEGAVLDPEEACDLLTMHDVFQAKQLLGNDVPFVVSCYGVTEDNLTPDLSRILAHKVVGIAGFINFNLPDQKHVPVEIAVLLWEEFGLVTEFWIHSEAEKAFLGRQSFPYLGLTDDLGLSTQFNVSITE